MKQIPTKCLTCTNKPRSRGLCTNCYSSTKELVGRNITSWQELEGNGLALPKIIESSPFYVAFSNFKQSQNHDNL